MFICKRLILDKWGSDGIYIELYIRLLKYKSD